MAARKVAIEVFSLVAEEGEKHGNHFWRKMKRLVDVFAVPLLKKKDERNREGKMTEKEARLFGGEPMPYGEFVGMKIDHVPLDRLLWYSEQTFVDELRRYVKSDRTQKEQGDV